jgi:hypothetical protein
MLQNIIKVFDQNLGKLKKEIEDCDEKNLWKTVDGIKNPVGNLCLHLVGNLNTFIGKNLGQTNYVRNRELEFTQKDLPKSLLIQQVENTKLIVIKTLESLDEKKLEETYPENILGNEMSTGFFLIYLLTHLSYHIGQINYLRRILD